MADTIDEVIDVFVYQKNDNDVVYEIAVNGKMYLYLLSKAYDQQFRLGKWCFHLSFQLGNETDAQLMKEHSARWFTLTERIGIAIRRLQGQTVHCVDVIDRENPDVDDVAIASSLQKTIVEIELPDEYCGALLLFRKQTEIQITVLQEVETEDAKLKQFFDEMICEMKQLLKDYQRILEEMDHDGQRMFSDNDDSERAWALDNGNYFDPNIPIMYDIE
ncbi:MAG: hypothetical protein PUF50_00850 [Erysipelotrichaceae bacterium]|nr:hypothetical protein [Erysipelotrichaceae bacterium]